MTSDQIRITLAPGQECGDECRVLAGRAWTQPVFSGVVCPNGGTESTQVRKDSRPAVYRHRMG